jgi:prefoldin subunit 5
MSTNKIDVSTVCEMFEKLNDKLDKQTINKPVEPVQVDLATVNTLIERLEDTIREVRKPVKVEHHHKIEIASNWVFLSLVGMGLMILGLSYFIGNQRQTITLYKDNNLKYRYIKMQGHTNEDNLYWLEQQFKYNDSIKIIRKQVEKYEELIKEQAERMAKLKYNSEEVKKLREEVDILKQSKQKR